MLLAIIAISIAAIIYIKRGSKKGKGSIDANGLPVGFNATHRHRNIALDSVGKKLWVKDESGRQRVFDASEIIGWEHASVQISKSGSCWNVKNYLVIQTMDLDRPLWRARFKKYQEAFPSDRNYHECSKWHNRLNASFNHNA